MKLENSIFANQYREKISYHFGNLYIFDTYVVNEINEGVNFNWELAEYVISDVCKYINPEKVDITYISNRVHSYSVSPQDWLKFYMKNHRLEYIAIVSNKESGFISVVLEKLFAKAKFRKFQTIEDAITWAKQPKVQDRVLK